LPQSKNLLILNEIVRNAVMAVPVVSRWRSRRGRTSVQVERIDEEFLRRYAYLPYETVCDRIGASGLEGLSVGEIGPGDHIPAALLFLGAGAESYACYDRFAGDLAGEYAKAIYRALVDDLRLDRPDLAQRLQSRGIEPDRFPEAFSGLVRVVSKPIETIDDEEYGQLDLLTSYNVVEHVYDIPAFAAQTCRMLRPGGLAIHRVDFGAHGKWLDQTNPLEWLTVPDSIWRLMGSKRGTPNRWRFHEVRDALTNAGFEVDADESEFFDEGDLASIRPSLAPRMRAMPDASLLVKTASFFCRRPEQGGRAEPG
jgi:hypothetical protein